MSACSLTDRYPPELLIIIFHHCVWLDRNGGRSVDVGKCPWTISQVCAYWRRICLGTPTLWTDISLSFKVVLPQFPSMLSAWKEDNRSMLAAYRLGPVPQIVLLRHQLTRSDGSPLTVTIRIAKWEIQLELLRHLADLLSLHSRRIQELVMQDDWALLPCLAGRQTSWPLLRRMEVTVNARRRSMLTHPRPPEFHAFRSATNLQTADFTYYIPSPTDIPWAELKELTLHCVEDMDVYNILPSLTGLIKLTVNFDDTDTEVDPFNDMNPIVLPSLEELYLNTAYLCWFITTPRLHTFATGPIREDGGVEAATNFVRRSKCTVRFLILHLDRINKDVVAPLLDVLTGVRKLECLYWKESTRSVQLIVEEMAAMDDHGYFKYFPQLESIFFDLPCIHPDRFVDMIQKRWDARRLSREGLVEGGTLRRAEFRLHEVFWSKELASCDGIVERARCLQEEGFDFVASYRDMYTGKVVTVI